MGEDWGHWIRFAIGLSLLSMFLGIAFQPEKTLYVMIILITYFALTQIVWWIGMWYRDIHPYVRKDKPPKIRKKHTPSLLGEWLKARKGKVCPPIVEVRNE